MPNALTGHSNAKAGCASSEGSACRFTTWSWKGMVGILDTYPGRGLKTTWEWTGPNTRHSSLTENACRAPTRLMEVSAVRSDVLRDRNFSLTESSGSKGPLWSPARTIESVVYQGPNQTNQDSIKAWLKHEKPNSTKGRTRQQQEVVNQIPSSSPSEYSLTSKPFSQNGWQH